MSFSIALRHENEINMNEATIRQGICDAENTERELYESENIVFSLNITREVSGTFLSICVLFRVLNDQ